MIELLLAAQPSAEVVRGMPADVIEKPAAQVVPAGARAKVYRDGLLLGSVVCRPNGILHTEGPGPALLLRPQDRLVVKYRRLGDLPKANHEKAVARSIGGCSAPLVVQYQVGP